MITLESGQEDEQQVEERLVTEKSEVLEAGSTRQPQELSSRNNSNFTRMQLSVQEKKEEKKSKHKRA